MYHSQYILKFYFCSRFELEMTFEKSSNRPQQGMYFHGTFQNPHKSSEVCRNEHYLGLYKTFCVWNGILHFPIDKVQIPFSSLLLWIASSIKYHNFSIFYLHNNHCHCRSHSYVIITFCINFYMDIGYGFLGRIHRNKLT